MANSETLL
ncbi:hypothetical protein YPPY66_2403, partial [Yersinia pestis PY-66]